MKFNILFVSTGICCAVLIGCNQPQKQESATNNNDDIIWKASLSYCLTKEKPDLWLLQSGIENEDWQMYNFKAIEEKGQFRNLMRLLYDSAISKTYPLYSVDPANGLFPTSLLTQKEKLSWFSDTIASPATGKFEIISDFFKLIKGLNISHEWLYDVKAGTLTSTITDADLLLRYSGNEPYMVNIAALKFSTRTIDSMGIDQPGLKPEIVWGREVLIPIIDSGLGLEMMTNERWVRMDSLSKYTVNGVPSHSRQFYPVPIKSNFNKKLVEWVWLGARKGQLPVYYSLGKDSIGNRIPTKNMKDFGSVIDTICDESGNLKPVKYEISTDNLSGLELKEDIAFHKSTFTFESKISYVGILVNSIDKNTGKPFHHTSTVLYWVKLN